MVALKEFELAVLDFPPVLWSKPAVRAARHNEIVGITFMARTTAAVLPQRMTYAARPVYFKWAAYARKRSIFPRQILFFDFIPL